MKTICYTILLISYVFFTGCVSYPSLLNYNEPPKLPAGDQPIENYKALTVQPHDLLQINVSSTNAQALQPFQLLGSTEQESGSGNEFLVDKNGNIDFPTLGSIAVGGLEVDQIKTKIQEALAPYFETPPVVMARLTNFKVTVSGEVTRPGTFTVNGDRLTILEAITMAGDFTTYSRRDSVMITREEGGIRSFGYVNFNSAEVFSSPYFYLQQNDAIYIRPNKSKVNTVRDPSSRFLPWITAFVSLAALVISITR